MQDTQQMNHKYIATQKRMEEKAREVKGDFGKSIDSATKHFEARLAEGSKSQEMAPIGPSSAAKSEGGPIVPPGLKFGGGR